MFEKLKGAISTNNVAELTNLIALCNKQDLIKSVAIEEYESLLHLASEKGNCEIFNLLLSKDPSLINLIDCGGYTVLHYAVEKGHVEMVDLLLDKMPLEKIKTGVSACYLSYDAGSGYTALHLACFGGHKDIIEKLLTKCPELINISTHYSIAPLNCAANDEIAELLLSKMSLEVTLKVIKQTDGMSGRNALHSAISNGNIKTAEKLLALDIDLAKVASLHGHTALFCAAVSDKLKGREIELAEILTPKVIKMSLEATTKNYDISVISHQYLNKILSVCDEALAKDSHNASIYFKKANILYGLDKKEEAIKCYETAQSINPDYAEKIHINTNFTINAKEEKETSSGVPDHLNTTTVADQQQEETVEAIGKSEDGFCILI